MFSFSVPLFEAPDEPHHLLYVDFIAANHRLPNLNTSDRVEVPNEGYQPPLYYTLAAGLLNLLGRSRVDPQISKNPAFPTVPHVLNAYVHSPDEYLQPDALIVHIIRLLSVFCGAVTVFLTYEMARTIQLRTEVALLAAAINASIPEFLFLTGTVSNDSLSWMTASLTLLFTFRLYMKKDVNWLNVFYLGAALTGALLTKATSLILVPFIIAVLAVKGILEEEDQMRLGLLKATICLAAMVFLLAGWWYVRGVVLYGDFTGLKMNAELNPSLVVNRSIWSSYFENIFPIWVFSSFWAVFGWMNIWPMNVWPGQLYFGFYSVVSAVGAGGAIIEIKPSGPLSSRRMTRITLLILIGFSILALAALIALNLSVDTPQGRFLFVAISPICVLLAQGLNRSLRTKPDWFSHVVLLALVVVMFALSVHFLFFLRAIYST